MHRFHKLEHYNKDRDSSRRFLAEDVLRDNGIKYTCPQKGHFKIGSKKCHTLMFYPKSGVLIWKAHRQDFQHKFTNDDEGKLIAKIKELV